MELLWVHPPTRTEVECGESTELQAKIISKLLVREEEA